MAASPRVGVSTADRNDLPSLVFLRRTLGGRQAPESAAFFVFQPNTLTRTTSTPTRGRVQPGAGFDPLRGVSRLQPYLRAGPRQLKPALGGK